MVIVHHVFEKVKGTYDVTIDEFKYKENIEGDDPLSNIGKTSIPHEVYVNKTDSLTLYKIIIELMEVDNYNFKMTLDGPLLTRKY